MLARVRIKDRAGVHAYLAQPRPILAQFGGELLLQGRPVEALLEGVDAEANGRRPQIREFGPGTALVSLG